MCQAKYSANQSRYSYITHCYIACTAVGTVIRPSNERCVHSVDNSVRLRAEDNRKLRHRFEYDLGNSIYCPIRRSTALDQLNKDHSYVQLNEKNCLLSDSNNWLANFSLLIQISSTF